MHVDVATSTLAGGLVTFASGLFLLIYWHHDRTASAAFWTALAHCGMGAGLTMLPLDAVLPAFLPHIVAPVLFNVGALLAYVAARVFRTGYVSRFLVIAGAGLWIVLQILTAVLTGEKFAVILGVTVSASLYAAAAAEFWRGRNERLRCRTAMTCLLAIHAIGLFLVAVQFATATGLAFTAAPTVDWLGVIHVIGLVYGVGVTVFLTTMLNERSEAKHKAAASLDPLTGLANRRGFMNRAAPLFNRRAQETLKSISVLAFDLDRFKTINDTYGHATGDRVLQVFADVLARSVRSTDVVGRIGGEEFVAVLVNADETVALAVAERIRNAFHGDAHLLEGKPIGATVSIGVATSTKTADEITQVIAHADAAMYRAKQSGRNRVILADADGYAATNVIRIA